MLRDYQIEICARVREALGVHRSVMVQMPTGTGKTVVLASIVREWRAADRVGSSILIVAHRRELIEQIKATVKRMGIDRQGIVVESVQTIARRLQHASLGKERVGLVVVDEAHHALAKTYQMMWKAWPEAKFLGLTATPWRMSGEGFTDLFEVLVQADGIKRFIAEGWLCAYDYYAVRPDSEDQQRIDGLVKRGADGDFQTKEMREKLDDTPCIERLFATYQRHAAGKKGIVYAIDIVHAEHIAAYYRQKGVEAEAICSKTAVKRRKELIERFKVPTGQLQGVSVLVSVDLFAEGFDCPDMEFIQIARPTLSLAKYLQMVGRGLRRQEGKVCCIIIDHVGLYRAFGLPSADRDWKLAFEGEEQQEGMTCGKGYSLERGMIPRSLLEEGEDEVVKIVSHEGMASLFKEAEGARFERVRSAEGKLVWRDGVNGVTFSHRPKVVDFAGLELATEDGVLFFPRIASKLIDGKCAIHLNLLKMQLGDGVLWKKRYISLSNPTQVFKWVETLPNGMRLFEDEQGRCFLQQDPDHPLVAEWEVSREEMMRRCEEERLKIDRINRERKERTGVEWIKRYPIWVNELTLQEEWLQRVKFGDRKWKERMVGWVDMKSDYVYLQKPETLRRGCVELLREEGMLYVRNIEGLWSQAYPNYAIRADERLCIIGNRLFLKRYGTFYAYDIMRKSEDLTFFVVRDVYANLMIVNKPGQELEVAYSSVKE